MDTVYVIKDQIKDLQQVRYSLITHTTPKCLSISTALGAITQEQQRLRRELEDERKARKKLESIVQKTLHSSRIPVPAMNQSGDCSA